MGRLQDRIAVVTGSGAGMGEGIARLFAGEGAASSSQAEMRKRPRSADSIVKSGGRPSFSAADVTIEADCRALIEAAVTRYGRIDVLVNNVGCTRGISRIPSSCGILFATNAQRFHLHATGRPAYEGPRPWVHHQHRFGQRLHR
jgi:NAD(P)-dependent dehydrogenase (short-subunit alcohol dehydrogenase family)